MECLERRSFENTISTANYIREAVMSYLVNEDQVPWQIDALVVKLINQIINKTQKQKDCNFKYYIVLIICYIIVSISFNFAINNPKDFLFLADHGNPR